MSNVVIIGATSAVAIAIARLHAMAGDTLYLIGRNAQKLDELCADLIVRGAHGSHYDALDFASLSTYDALWERVESILDAPDIVYVAHGVLPDNLQCQNVYEQVVDSFSINVLSVIGLVAPIANRMEENKKGKIAVLSSVAGDRGRQSNYIYGAQKAAISTYLQGLRNRLFKAGVSVTTVKPGFIDTPMTASFDKTGPLWATPEKVAADIVKGVSKNRNVIYTPWFWALIMLLIKLIPEPIFKRLSL
jgi:hypothetical protein